MERKIAKDKKGERIIGKDLDMIEEEVNPIRVLGRFRREGGVKSDVIEVDRWFNVRKPFWASSQRREQYEGSEYDEEEEFENVEEHHWQGKRPQVMMKPMRVKEGKISTITEE
ncbi:hypothetical protein FNV43_RR24677 [Rhamnella rubrinervis]|uniref:Uncharacterized protein n=1 Tax=Rhamnella rubrinervis TaxID=2594499 RepID=A0A8K0DTJ4_9ROSA|nr:hypothetical protein FNV43_RR24677 [Rhamnella rubrinervis]